MPFPSCWLASPLRPSRGSSSALLWLMAGFSSGIPVAEDIVEERVQGRIFGMIFIYSGVREGWMSMYIWSEFRERGISVGRLMNTKMERFAGLYV